MLLILRRDCTAVEREGVVQRVEEMGLIAHPVRLDAHDVIGVSRDAGPVDPTYFDVVSASIDVLTEFLRKSREAADPADLPLAADLTDMSTLEFYRAGHAIDEGARITCAAADAVAGLTAD